MLEVELYLDVQEPWLQLSSYFFPGEGNEEALATAQEVLSFDLSEKDVTWPERVAGHNSKVTASSTAGDLGEGRPSVPFGLKTGKQALIIAVVICLLSCYFSYRLA